MLRESECERTTAIPDTLQVRALAYDHYCDLQRAPKGAASARRTAHTAFFLAAFSRGVILIGALSKGLRFPLLQESGRLRQKWVTQDTDGK